VNKFTFISVSRGLDIHSQFYEAAVYRKAARIGKELAENMDTCIIK